VAKVGTSKVGGTISQQAAVHPWKQTNKSHNNISAIPAVSISKKVEICCLVDKYSSFAESGPSKFTAHPQLLSFMMKRVSVMYQFNDVQTWGQFQGWTSRAVTPTPDPCVAGASNQL
jgi:hypothetical protein